MTIISYYGKLKKLWEELGNYETIPICKCGLCKCNLSSEMEKKREEEKVHQFVMVLDDVAQDPLPPLNKIYSILVQEERVRTISHNKEEHGDVLAYTV